MTRSPIRRQRRRGVWAPLAVAVLVVAASPWPRATASPAGGRAPAPGSPTAALAAMPSSASQVMEMGQGVTVTVPAGLLVLTQRCGTYGAGPAVPAAPGYPGFPRALPAIPAKKAAAGTVSPATCAAGLGEPEVVRGGHLAGSAISDGRLSQVTVMDTRSPAVGWTLLGSVAELRSTTGSSLDPDLLGWAPSVGRPLPTPEYRPVVTAGPRVLPGQGRDGRAPGLGQPSVLASAQAGKGLGLATVDARLQLVVPPGLDPGPYTAVVTLTVF